MAHDFEHMLRTWEVSRHVLSTVTVRTANFRPGEIYMASLISPLRVCRTLSSIHWQTRGTGKMIYKRVGRHFPISPLSGSRAVQSGNSFQIRKIRTCCFNQHLTSPMTCSNRIKKYFCFCSLFPTIKGYLVNVMSEMVVQLV